MIRELEENEKKFTQGNKKSLWRERYRVGLHCMDNNNFISGNNNIFINGNNYRFISNYSEITINCFNHKYIFENCGRFK